ncbi:hypothetical protein [Desulfogranum japonicum]|uniref:hypothetical protein n=1 Tax=Desulfogranum japonicum TaxID=231447 RepID=UPI000410CF83|nr:hypothetical protein [Desulfogranum japonicum]
MSEQTFEMDDLLDEINVVLEAAENDDADTLYDHRASIISIYAQAMAEFHFSEEKLEWLNAILKAVEDNQPRQCLSILEREQDTEVLFLGSQFASVMAGCYHHDECQTAVQAVGLKALLLAMKYEQNPDDHVEN